MFERIGGSAMDAKEIRERFVDYYRGMGFLELPRAPLLHPSIPMSFVMSAGLVQVETSLAQVSNRPGDRFVLVQECFRHFDLGAVGSDATHLSFFEMPGAFTFRSSGKDETVRRMWALATQILGIDPGRVWASYFRGDRVQENDMPADDLVRQTWVEVGLPAERVVGLGSPGCFWLQGEGIRGSEVVRKCGPNTELFYDRGSEYNCGEKCRPGCGCGRFVEFANSLFINGELDTASKKITPLADPFTETVIGTERVAMIVQKAPSVFDIEGYRQVIQAIDRYVDDDSLPESLVVTSERIIADHLRALYSLIADGAPSPGKNGRRRIIKKLIRGVVTRQVILGIDSADFIPAILGHIARFLPQAVKASPRDRERLLGYFSGESQRFLRTVERGRRHVSQLLEKNSAISGTQMALLEKEWGLPRILTEHMLKGMDLPSVEEYRVALGR